MSKLETQDDGKREESIVNRSRQQKEQLVRKFEEILPFLKNYDKFGWIIPECDADPVYKILPDISDPANIPFKEFTVNVQTGWHSGGVYRVGDSVHKIDEDVTPIRDEWSSYCYKSHCVCKTGR